jgi:hypothetical protein
MAGRGKAVTAGGVAVALCLLATLVACQASPSPTPLVRSMTVTLGVPVADKAVISAAEEVFARRLTALGISDFTIGTGEVMTFRLVVPAAFDAAIVDAALRRVGLVQFVPWPANSQPPEVGDPVPPTYPPLFDDQAGVGSAEVAADSSDPAALDITLHAVGREAIETYTAEQVGSFLPITLDGFVLAVPTIQSPITDGMIRLTFPDTPPIPLESLAAMITSGPLPAAWGGQP